MFHQHMEFLVVDNLAEVNFLFLNIVMTVKVYRDELQSAVVKEVERWLHTAMSVGSNPSAAVDSLP